MSNNKAMHSQAGNTFLNPAPSSSRLSVRQNLAYGTNGGSVTEAETMATPIDNSINMNSNINNKSSKSPPNPCIVTVRQKSKNGGTRFRYDPYASSMSVSVCENNKNDRCDRDTSSMSNGGSPTHPFPPAHLAFPSSSSSKAVLCQNCQNQQQEQSVVVERLSQAQAMMRPPILKPVGVPHHESPLDQSALSLSTRGDGNDGGNGGNNKGLSLSLDPSASSQLSASATSSSSPFNSSLVPPHNAHNSAAVGPAGATTSTAQQVHAPRLYELKQGIMWAKQISNRSNNKRQLACDASALNSASASPLPLHLPLPSGLSALAMDASSAPSSAMGAGGAMVAAAAEPISVKTGSPGTLVSASSSPWALADKGAPSPFSPLPSLFAQRTQEEKEHSAVAAGADVGAASNNVLLFDGSSSRNHQNHKKVMINFSSREEANQNLNHQNRSSPSYHNRQPLPPGSCGKNGPPRGRPSMSLSLTLTSVQPPPPSVPSSSTIPSPSRSAQQIRTIQQVLANNNKTTMSPTTPSPSSTTMPSSASLATFEPAFFEPNLTTPSRSRHAATMQPVAASPFPAAATDLQAVSCVSVPPTAAPNVVSASASLIQTIQHRLKQKDINPLQG